MGVEAPALLKTSHDFDTSSYPIKIEPLTPKEVKGFDGAESAYKFTTIEGEEWKLLFKFSRDYERGESYSYDEFIVKFNNGKQSEQESARQHHETVNFISNHWDTLQRYFRPYGKSNNGRIAHFKEASLNGHGTPDFVGLGPDGTIYVIEVGLKKHPKIRSYMTEIEKIMERGRSIEGFAVSYDFSQGDRVLRVSRVDRTQQFNQAKTA